MNEDTFYLQTPPKKYLPWLQRTKLCSHFFFFMVKISTHSTLWHYRKIKNYQGPFLGKVNINWFRSEISAQSLYYLLTLKGASPYSAQNVALDPTLPLGLPLSSSLWIWAPHLKSQHYPHFALSSFLH